MSRHNRLFYETLGVEYKQIKQGAFCGMCSGTCMSLDIFQRELRQITSTVRHYEVSVKAGLPLTNKNKVNWLHAQRMQCMREETCGRYGITLDALITEMYHIFLEFALENDRRFIARSLHDLAERKRERDNLVTPQMLHKMVTPVDLLPPAGIVQIGDGVLRYHGNVRTTTNVEDSASLLQGNTG